MKLDSQFLTERKLPSINQSPPSKAFFLLSRLNFTVKKYEPRAIKIRFSCNFHSVTSFVLRYWWLNLLSKALMIIKFFQGAYILPSFSVRLIDLLLCHPQYLSHSLIHLGIHLKMRQSVLDWII